MPVKPKKKSRLVEPQVSQENGGSLIKPYHIETFDGGAYLNFYTEAKDKKEALNNLLKNSWDFKNLTNEDKNWTIKIRLIP